MQPLAERVIRALSGEPALLAFQEQWVRDAFAPDTEIAALSCPRGAGKTWLLGKLAALAISPGSPLFEAGVEVLGVSGSLEQSRILLNFAWQALGARQSEYRRLDSGQRLALTHKPSGTRLRILSSSGKRAMGLSEFGLILADEPASWEGRAGALMWDALRTSLGKREGQRLLLIGTLSPAPVGSWWPELIGGGSCAGIHVTRLGARLSDPWDEFETAVRANPVISASPSMARTVRRELEAAKQNEGLRPAYRAYRLNLHETVGRELLLTVDAWEQLLARAVPEREGLPVLGFDSGASRAWHGAWAIWPNGRSEVWGCAPGIPGLAERERADGVPEGLYQRAAESGSLIVEKNVRWSNPGFLIQHVLEAGVQPVEIICDRFQAAAVRDAASGVCPVNTRMARWSESTEDVVAFRKLVHDGFLSIVRRSAPVAEIALSETDVQTDEQGSMRVRKARGMQSRDDVAMAGVLAAGAVERKHRAPQMTLEFIHIPF